MQIPGFPGSKLFQQTQISSFFCIQSQVFQHTQKKAFPGFQTKVCTCISLNFFASLVWPKPGIPTFWAATLNHVPLHLLLICSFYHFLSISAHTLALLTLKACLIQDAFFTVHFSTASLDYKTTCHPGYGRLLSSWIPFRSTWGCPSQSPSGVVQKTDSLLRISKAFLHSIGPWWSLRVPGTF